MSQLIFNEETYLNNNIFKYENRLLSQTNRFIENGAMLVTYYSIEQSATTVDRGVRDVEILFGRGSAVRYNKIMNFPVYGFGQTNPNNTDELQIEDINVEGDFTIQPSTIVPAPNDIFIINHLKMKALFQVVEVTFDSMKVEGFYKCRYRLHSTSDELLLSIENQIVDNFHTELDAIGSRVNPIIQVDDFVRKQQIQQMVSSMIQSYRALFYNERHNCFLFHHQQEDRRWFDMCANEFIAKHSLMNAHNSGKVIILHDKLRDETFPMMYNHSVYNWIEIGAPKKMLQKFHFQLMYADNYTDSSFSRWGDGDIQVIHPLAIHQVGILNQDHSYFDHQQLEAFESDKIPATSEFEQLIQKYINQPNSISLNDVSLNTADTLLSSIRHLDVFFFTPIIIYIIRKILKFN